MKRRTVIIALILALLLSAIPFTVLAEDDKTPKDASSGLMIPRENTGGIDHSSAVYLTEKKSEKLPVTFEAWVYIPSLIYSQRGGIILGNYVGYANDEFINFEIHTKGVPRFLIYENDGTTHDYKFTSAPVPADTWTHVTIVYGTGYEGRQIFCYINGELRQATTTDKWYGATEHAYDTPFRLAGDLRTLNEQGFRGSLGDVTVYSDVRTHDEIASDMKKGADLDDPELLMAYKLFGAKPGEDIPDLSGNGYDMIYTEMWLTEAEMQALRDKDDKEYAYTIAFLPDVQHSTSKYPDKLKLIFDYLLQNKDVKNIQYVIALGDQANNNKDSEWKTFKAQCDRLDGILPYSLVRGNHDLDFTEEGWKRFDKYYGKGSYYHGWVAEHGGFCDEESSKNTYLLFSVGEVDYLILNLDFGAEDHVLEWADGVLSKYPDRRVIAVTHAYLGADGTTLDSSDAYCPSEYNEKLNDSDELWEKLLSKHENVDMIVSGHIPQDGAVHSVARGDNGNVVHQLLMDPQGLDKTIKGDGVLGLMYFTEDGNFAKLEYYSARFDAYLRSSNELIRMDFTDPAEEPPIVEETAPEQSNTETESGENIPESSAEPDDGKESGTETDKGAGNKPDRENNGIVIVLSAVAFVATAVAVTELIIIMRRKKK